jgi:hypothetical protein
MSERRALTVLALACAVEFRELASEALLTQRKVFCAFQEEPRKAQDGFCLRHGFTELYATDSVCVLCASEVRVRCAKAANSRKTHSMAALSV